MTRFRRPAARPSPARPVRPPRAPTLSLVRALLRAASWHRRGLAAVAAAVAVVSGLAAAAPPAPPTTEVLRAARELPGGTVLSPADLTLSRVAEADLPDRAARDPAELIGRVLGGPVAAGQVLTDLAVVAPGLTAPGRVVAPVRLADPAVVRLLRAGDRVDVLAADRETSAAAVVAAGVRVLAVPAAGEEAEGALVLLEVDRPTAGALAGAAASATLSVSWR